MDATHWWGSKDGSSTTINTYSNFNNSSSKMMRVTSSSSVDNSGGSSFAPQQQQQQQGEGSSHHPTHKREESTASLQQQQEEEDAEYHLPGTLRYVRSAVHDTSTWTYEEACPNLISFTGLLRYDEPMFRSTTKKNHLSPRGGGGGGGGGGGTNRRAGGEQTVSLNANHLLLQSSVIRVTPWVVGMAVYTGNSTRVGMTKKNPPTKWARLDKRVNQLARGVVIFQLAFILFFAIMGDIFYVHHSNTAWYIYDKNPNQKRTWWIYFYFIMPLRYFCLGSLMIPISFKVTVDLSKYYIALVIGWDQRMYDPAKDVAAKANNTALVEDLGQIQFLLSDKTGTLTENRMEFKHLMNQGSEEILSLKRATGAFNTPSSSLSFDASMADGDASAAMLGRILALCNAVAHDPSTSTPDNAQWTSASPDEVALVKGAKDRGVTLLARSRGFATIRREWIQAAVAVAVDDSSSSNHPSCSKKDGGTGGKVEGAEGGVFSGEEPPSPTSTATPLTGADNMRKRPTWFNTTSSINTHHLQSTAPELGTTTNPTPTADTPTTFVANATEEEYRIIATIPFTSGRAKMSVIVERVHTSFVSSAAADVAVTSSLFENPQSRAEAPPSLRDHQVDQHADADGAEPTTPTTPGAQSSGRRSPTSNATSAGSTFYLFTKGADERMFPILLSSTLDKTEVLHSLDHYSCQGLRTLLYGYRVLPKEEMTRWLASYKKASNVTTAAEREDAMTACYDSVEKGLQFAGLSAVEDALQAEAPETIQKIRDAGIRVWMLTGDKLQTAKQIGQSSNLLRAEEYRYEVDCLETIPEEENTEEPGTFDDAAAATGHSDCRHPQSEAFQQLRHLEQVIQGAQSDALCKFPALFFGEEDRVAGEEGQKKTGEGEAEDDVQKKAMKQMPPVDFDCEYKTKDFLAEYWCRGHYDPTTGAAMFGGHKKKKQRKQQERKGGTYQPPPIVRSSPRAINASSGSSSAASSKSGSGGSRLSPWGTTTTYGSNSTVEERQQQPLPTQYSVIVTGRALRVLTSCGDSDSGDDVNGTSTSATAAAAMVHEKKRKKEIFTTLEGILLRASTVICCRVTPDQKALIVNLVKRNNGMTLAIGDGGNDVAMIQEAHVGVGITGNEGRAAAAASDFCFAQFRFLQPLLLVHGHTAYQRTAFIVQFSFYKAMIIAICQLLYNGVASFSGVSFFDSFGLATWNGVYTTGLTMFYVFDRQLPPGVLLTDPSLFSLSQRGRYLNPWTFFIFMVRAIWQGTIVWLVVAFTMDGNQTINPEGHTSSWELQYVPVYCCLLFLVTEETLRMMHSVTALNFLAMWVGIIGYFVLSIIYAAFRFNPLYHSFNEAMYGTFWNGIGYQHEPDPKVYLAQGIRHVGQSFHGDTSYASHRHESRTGSVVPLIILLGFVAALLPRWFASAITFYCFPNYLQVHTQKRHRDAMRGSGFFAYLFRNFIYRGYGYIFCCFRGPRCCRQHDEEDNGNGSSVHDHHQEKVKGASSGIPNGEDDERESLWQPSGGKSTTGVHTPTSPDPEGDSGACSISPSGRSNISATDMMHHRERVEHQQDNRTNVAFLQALTSYK